MKEIRLKKKVVARGQRRKGDKRRGLFSLTPSLLSVSLMYSRSFITVDTTLQGKTYTVVFPIPTISSHVRCYILFQTWRWPCALVT